MKPIEAGLFLKMHSFFTSLLGFFLFCRILLEAFEFFWLFAKFDTCRLNLLNSFKF
jgi:hypothetical protein